VNSHFISTASLFKPTGIFLARIFSSIYIAWIVINQLPHPLFYIVVPLAIVSGVITLLILERFRYDFRSSAILLILICQLYFFGRVEFVSKPWGWFYVLGHAAYMLFLVGMFGGIKFFRSNKLKIVSRSTTSFQPASASNLYIIGFSTLIVFYAILEYILMQVGASGTFLQLVFQSLSIRLSIAESGLSPLLQLIYLLSNFGLGCGFILWRDRRKLFLLLAWIVMLAYSALVLGSRGAIIFPILQILLATSLLVKKPVRLLASVAIPFVIIVNVFSVWYLSAREGQDSLSNEGYTLLSRFDAYENWLGYSANQGLEFSPFASLPSAFMQFVPRKIYPDKPYYFSTEMTRTYIPDAFDSGINLDFGGIAESVYNFGPIGPLFFGFFIAWVISLMDRFKGWASNLNDSLSAYIFSLGALMPAFFFTIGWINTALIFVVIGFILNIKVFNMITRKNQ